MGVANLVIEHSATIVSSTATALNEPAVLPTVDHQHINGAADFIHDNRELTLNRNPGPAKNQT